MDCPLSSADSDFFLKCFLFRFESRPLKDSSDQLKLGDC